MYFLPSYGRPHSFARLIASPGGMPDLTVVINEDDPARAEYERLSPWPIIQCPAGSRFTDAWRFAHQQFPDLPWYGMLGDDHIPQTRGWHELLVKEASTKFLAYPNGAHTEFPLMRGVCVLGGELVKTLGWIVPPGFKHNYIDVVLDQICRDTDLLRSCADIRVDHEHWKFVQGVERDVTYERGSVDQHDDMVRYHHWMMSLARHETTARVAAWKKTWENP